VPLFKANLVVCKHVKIAPKTCTLHSMDFMKRTYGGLGKGGAILKWTKGKLFFGMERTGCSLHLRLELCAEMTFFRVHIDQIL